jgi:hypothetical protein
MVTILSITVRIDNVVGPRVRCSRYRDDMSTEITVRGSFSAFERPERGTVHATIGYEGASMEPVYGRVARDLDAVKASIGPLADKDSGPVTWWSADQLRTWSRRPWNTDGKQLPLVHHASVGLEVKFRDFGALSQWVSGHIGELEGFRVARVEWALTEKRRDTLAKEVRTRAVRDAATRAQAYADALGLGQIRPVAIADAGMLGARPESESATSFMRAAAVGGTSDVELVPEHIEVSAMVDAHFIAVTGSAAPA